MTIGENIKYFRKEKGLTQKELGNLCGINEVQIRRYELGGSNPKLETIQKIATALGVEPYALDDRLFFHADHTAPITLKDEQLLNAFHKLNDFGQTKVLERIEELLEVTKYLI